MSFDPRDGDRDDPGRGLGDDGSSLPPRPRVEHDPGPGTTPPEQVTDPYVELLLREAAGDGSTRPYLTRIPEDASVEETVFDWLDFLVSTAGVTGATAAIERYESLGWLGERAAGDLEDYLLGVGTTADPEADGLGRRDHVRSLVFVAELAAALDR